MPQVGTRASTPASPRDVALGAGGAGGLLAWALLLGNGAAGYGVTGGARGARVLLREDAAAEALAGSEAEGDLQLQVRSGFGGCVARGCSWHMCFVYHSLMRGVRCALVDRHKAAGLIGVRSKFAKKLAADAAEMAPNCGCPNRQRVYSHPLTSLWYDYTRTGSVL